MTNKITSETYFGLYLAKNFTMEGIISVESERKAQVKGHVNGIENKITELLKELEWLKNKPKPSEHTKQCIADRSNELSLNERKLENARELLAGFLPINELKSKFEKFKKDEVKREKEEKENV